MAADATEREIRALLKKHGTFIRHANHGELYGLPGGQTALVVGGDAARYDQRTMKNTLAEIKRALRAAGVLGSQEGTVETQEEPTMDKARLSELGIHVQSEKRVVKTIHEADQVTADMSGIARLLGLDPNAGAELIVECPCCGAEVNGKTTPLTFKITRVRSEEDEE